MSLESLPDEIWYTYFRESAQVLHDTCCMGRRLFPQHIVRMNVGQKQCRIRACCIGLSLDTKQCLQLTLSSTAYLRFSFDTSSRLHYVMACIHGTRIQYFTDYPDVSCSISLNDKSLLFPQSRRSEGQVTQHIAKIVKSKHDLLWVTSAASC